MKKLVILFVLLGLVLACIYFLNQKIVKRQLALDEKKPLVIGFSMGTTREERWFVDRDLFVEKAQALGATVIVSLSDYDVEKQISQIENLISQGAGVIVIIPSDSEKLASVIEKAKQAGVKIIAYDRLIKNSDINLYISFNNVKVGELQAESVLAVVNKGNFAYIGGSPTDNNSSLLKEGTMNVIDQSIKNGDINLVVDAFTEDWRPEVAYKTINDYLDSGGKLDAVIAANDGTASGVIQALKERGLAGRIPVSGQDAELSAMKRINDGTQTSTIYKPIIVLAYRAASLAVAMALGQELVAPDSIDNGKIQVPAYFLEPIAVDKTNMVTTVIKDGFHSYEDIYGSVKK